MEDDLESLQARIDLSMSYTDSLVLSWFAPTGSVSGTSFASKNVEKEILEQMRLPQRLGVGASVSETAAGSSREANKLKSKLLGKKRRRESEESAPKALSDSSDNGEDSKARAIKKKSRVDPFAKSKGKVGALAANILEQSHEDAEFVIAPPSPLTPKKSHFSLSITSPIPDAAAALLIKSPVLNLDGPVGENSDDQVHSVHDSSQTSPKKKRKRKHKKKKNHTDVVE